MLTGKKLLLWVSVALVAVGLLTAACGGGDDEEGSSNTPDVAATPDTTGVTDTEIKLGTHYPLSGNPAAAYAPISYGMKAFFDYINDQGGIYGRKINFIIADDHYNPPDTVEVVRKMVEQDEVFGIISGLGEETHSAVWKYLEERGIPDMYLSTGLDKWTNPLTFNRFSGNPDYITEGIFLGQYIAKTWPGAKLGILEQSDQLGQDGDKGLRIGLEGSDVEITAVEKYDVIQSDVTAQTQRLKNAGVDVVAAFAIPPQAASMVKTARETLEWDVPFVVSAINCSEIFILLATPEFAEGIISSVFGHQAYDPGIPGVEKYKKIWEKYQNGASGTMNNFELYGMSVAEATVWGLEMAGPDLSRQSYLKAAESMCDVWCSTCIDFGPWQTSPTDHKINEVLIINKVVNGAWVPEGEITSYESTKECTPMTPPPGFEDQPKVGLDAEFVDVP